MDKYLYLSLIPEALILSQLPPEKFGNYTATGSKRQIEGPAVFFEIDQSADLPDFRMEEAQSRCVPHEDGSPRASVYLAVYNVLARIPFTAIKRAYLTTPSGLTLGLDAAKWDKTTDEKLFLYQELGPVYPRVASRLEPQEFCSLVTSPDKLVSLPRVAFIDLKLGPLAFNPDAKTQGMVPYQNLPHLRDCLHAISDTPTRMTKIVNRGLRPDILFYLIRSGLFFGDGNDFLYFPLPEEETLERQHTLWWHSAQSARGY